MTLTTTQIIDKTNYFKITCAPFTNRGYDRIKRHWSYVNSGGTAALVHKASATSCIFMGAAIGGLLGAKAGEKIGTSLSENTKVITVSTGLGFTIGATIGAGGGVCIYISASEKSPYYNEWKDNKINKLLNDAVCSDNCNDVVLNNFICPLGLMVMDWPARTPSGHSYEKAEILKYKAGSTTISDPMRNRVFDVTELLDDFETCFIINKRVLYLLNAYDQQLSNESDIKKGITNLIIDFQEIARCAYEEAKAIIEERRVASRDTKRYREEIDEFFTTFGNSPYDDIDWSIPWKDKLNQRWRYFYPSAVILDQ